LPKPKVFVSYSHKDKKALGELKPFLKPLERDGVLSAWDDTRIAGGADWQQEIDQALGDAKVAVLLISQDFLASDFIIEKELPRILEREAKGQLTILPVFLSPSLVGDVGFSDPRTSGRTKVFLTKFQGYGLPEKPLSKLSWSDRQRIYTDLARDLKTLAGATPAAGPPIAIPAPSAPVAAASSGPARSFELTVQLEDRGENLLVTYQLPGQEPLSQATVPWTEVKRRIDPIHEALNEDISLKLLPRLSSSADWGETLFGLLFGSVDRWEPVFRTLFNRLGGPRPSPSAEPVRLRIQTEDSSLSGLPWRLTTWKSQPLLDARWIFSTTHEIDPGKDVLTTAPSNVLIVAPQAAGNGGGPHDPEHSRAVRDVLKKAWPTGRDAGYVQEARTQAELEEALREHRPHVLYFYGHGSGTGGRPRLLLDGAELALADLRQLFKDTGHTPAVIYLNAEGLTDTAGPTPDQIFGSAVPLLLWRRRPEWSADSTTTALRWLHLWLGQGQDPVAALHQVHKETLRSSCESCTVAVHSNYRTWKTSLYQGSASVHHPLLRLDRDHQKSLVRKHLEELVRSGNRRVMAIVPYAEAGNSIPDLWSQLRHDLELSLSHLADIAWVQLELPMGRADFGRDLEEELKLQLNAKPNQAVRSLLRERAPRAVGPNRKPVLWINWVPAGAGSHAAPLPDEHLAAWLQFSSGFLVAHCPDDLRIVSYLALEVPKHEDFSHKLQELRRQPWCRTPAFRLSELPPLGKVGESDLLFFLEEAANSSCDAGIVTDVAERIIAQTGGAFEETVALIEEAENGSWYDLLARLRLEQEKKVSR
jgi:hypothetical protein